MIWDFMAILTFTPAVLMGMFGLYFIGTLLK
jgi:hypothetical protein